MTMLCGNSDNCEVMEEPFVFGDDQLLHIQFYDRWTYDRNRIPKRSYFFITPSLLCCCNWVYSVLHGFLMIVNIKTHQLLCMREYHSGSLACSYYQETGVIDVGCTGERWEGDLVNDKPFGMGKYYNERNKMIYEGIMVNGIRDVWGISYHSIASDDIIEYSGLWENDKMLKVGKTYDLKGQLLSNQSFDYSFNRSATLTAAVACGMGLSRLVDGLLTIELSKWEGCRLKRLIISDLPQLISIKIIEKCFYHCGECTITHLPRLETVYIGEVCFCGHVDDMNNLAFTIDDCHKLQSLVIGKISFRYYNMFKLTSNC